MFIYFFRYCYKHGDIMKCQWVEINANKKTYFNIETNITLIDFSYIFFPGCACLNLLHLFNFSPLFGAVAHVNDPSGQCKSVVLKWNRFIFNSFYVLNGPNCFAFAFFHSVLDIVFVAPLFIQSPNVRPIDSSIYLYINFNLTSRTLHWPIH